MPDNNSNVFSINGLKRWLEVVLSLFYAEVCQFCGQERAQSADGFVGAQCRKDMRFITPPLCGCCGLPFAGDLTTPFDCANCRAGEFAFSYARSAVAAQGVALEAIHKFKYAQALWVEPFLAQLLVNAAAPVLDSQSWDMIVPVPLHPAKRAERGFNQAERLARHLANATHLPLAPKALRRV